MSGYTKGPWLLDGGGFDPSQPGVLPRWTLVSATHHDTTGVVGAGIVDYSESRFAYVNAREPDAQLIAAAPELLEACATAALTITDQLLTDPTAREISLVLYAALDKAGWRKR